MSFEANASDLSDSTINTFKAMKIYTHTHNYLFFSSLSAHPVCLTSPGTALSVACNLRHTIVQGLKAVNTNTAVNLFRSAVYSCTRLSTLRCITCPQSSRKKRTLCSSYIFVPDYQTVRRHSPEACNRSHF